MHRTLRTGSARRGRHSPSRQLLRVFHTTFIPSRGHPSCRLLLEDNSSGLLPANVKSDVTPVRYLAPHRKLSGRPRGQARCGTIRNVRGSFSRQFFSRMYITRRNCARDARGSKMSSLRSKKDRCCYVPLIHRLQHVCYNYEAEFIPLRPMNVGEPLKKALIFISTFIFIYSNSDVCIRRTVK